MEATLRPRLEVENLESYEGVEAWPNKHRPFFKWSQRDRVLLRLFRTIQYRKLRDSPSVIRSEIRGELRDPYPYESIYVFYCMRLTGCSV